MASLSPELGEWCQRVLRELNEQFPPEIYGLYQPETNLPHYLALAARLDAQFGDPILAKSAFLHGIHSQELRRLSEGLLERSVLDVLEEREKLRALDARDPHVREQLLTNVLPDLREARAIVLFVIEQLHHLDSEDLLLQWSQEFHRCPTEPPEGLEVRFKDKTGRAELQGFIDSVLAPTADFFGLRRERNALEDASLLYFHKSRFDDLLALVLAESGPDGACVRVSRLVSKSLADLSASELLGICWEWRHIGGLAQAFTLTQQEWEDKRKGFRRALRKAGFVTVTCADEASCYRALYLLHKHFRYRPTELRDYLAKQSLDGYQALHTILALENQNSGFGEVPEAIAVRIMPTAEASRYRSSGQPHLESIAKRLTSNTGLGIRVFTPDGRGIPLPMGATVLEFASALNHSWLVHLAGATVNRRPASLLHRLNPGDVVWLEKSDDFLPLPRDWQDKVTSKETVREIVREFRRHARPFLERVGRSWLRERLQLQEGIEQLPEDGDLDSLLEDAANGTGHFQGESKASSILRAFGVVDFQGRGEDLPFTRTMDDGLLTRLVRDTAKELRKRDCLIVNDFDLPEDLRLLAKRTVLCPECKPSLAKPLLGKLEEGTLTLHRAGWECGTGGIAISRLRTTTRRQFFVLEVKNRIGLAATVFEVFQRHLVNVTEFVGMELGRQWGIARVETDRISQKRARQIMDDLSAITGVTRLVPPDEDDAPDWETPLPPRRRLGFDQLALSAPYLCGNEINDDNYFYGMIGARAELRKIFGETLHTELYQGRMAFIKGPKRAGKTSLAKFFLRELDRSTYSPCLTVYYETPRRGTSWSKAEGVICREILRRAHNLAGRLGTKLPMPKKELSLVEIEEHVQGQLCCTVVLAIDEAVGLFLASTQAGESGAISSLQSQIQGRPNFLVLWIGPTAEVRYLLPEHQSILNHAAQIPINTLNLPEAKSLLTAENFGLKYRIRVPHRLALTIHQVTRGNPYWISNIGRGMYGNRKENRKDGIILYSDDLLRTSIDGLFDERIPFLHCLEDTQADPPRPGCTRLILELLAVLDIGEGSDGIPLLVYCAISCYKKAPR